MQQAQCLVQTVLHLMRRAHTGRGPTRHLEGSGRTSRASTGVHTRYTGSSTPSYIAPSGMSTETWNSSKSMKPDGMTHCKDGTRKHESSDRAIFAECNCSNFLNFNVHPRLATKIFISVLFTCHIAALWTTSSGVRTKLAISMGKQFCWS